MRKLKLTFIFCIISFLSYSQIDTKIDQIDIVVSYIQNDVARFPELDGAGSVLEGKGICFGLNYNRKVAKRIWINSGVNFLRTFNDFNPAPTGEPLSTIENLETEIIRVPVKIRIDFLKWFYLKTGLTIDSELSNQNENYIDSQSGIGYSLSLGLNLKLTDLIYLNIEPELGYTTLIPFNSEKYQQHFLLSGVNFSIGFRF
jgi:hypothetical protein